MLKKKVETKVDIIYKENYKRPSEFIEPFFFKHFYEFIIQNIGTYITYKFKLVIVKEIIRIQYNYTKKTFNQFIYLFCITFKSCSNFCPLDNRVFGNERSEKAWKCSAHFDMHTRVNLRRPAILNIRI